MALIILAGLQTIPRSLYEAAEVDGAGRFRQFFEITLPLLKPSIVVALIFRTITALQTFDIPFTMTRGGPGTSTATLAMYIHQNTVDFLDLGYGGARRGHVRPLHGRDGGLSSHDPGQGVTVMSHDMTANRCSRASRCAS